MDIRVLGPFEVLSDAVGVPLRLGGPQQRTVLALLALRAGEVVATTSLVDALWPGEVPDSAVGVVHTYVSRLRRSLAAAGDPHPPRLERRAAGYVLEVDPDRIDARRFERLVGEARAAAAGGRPGAAVAVFDDALALWRGEVLADLPGLQAVQRDAGRLDQLRLGAVEERIDAELQLGRHAEVAAELGAVAEAHPFRERFWAQLMLALYRCGRQAEALAAYQRVRSLLVDQLGIEPGPELRGLEAAVLAHDPTLAWAPPAAAADPAATAAAADPPAPEPAAEQAPPAPRTGGNGSTAPPAQVPLPAALAHPAHDRVLAGRSRERTLLADAYAIARAGHFAAVFLGGPPGIGKTALAAWFARRAHADGATVVLGRADEVSPGPFRPLGEAIAHWAQHRPAPSTSGPGGIGGAGHGGHARLDADDVALLARIVPRLRPRPSAPAAPATTTVAPTSDPGGDDQDRLRLFDATARWVEELAAESAAPPVILLDDLQWADTGTLLAVRHLLRHPPGAGALLLVTHRDVDLGDGHDLLDLLAGVRGDGPARRVVLGGLAPADVVALLPPAGPAPVPTPTAAGPDHLGLADELVRVTGGNPLFVHETLRYLDERGGVAAGVDPVTGVLRLDRIGVPDGVKEVIERRLRRLPATTTSLLRWAAVLGDRVDRPVLARLVDRPELDVMATVEPAVTAGLATPDDAGWSFAHALVREAIADGLGQAEQARAHWKAGGVLQARPEVDRSAVARHLTAGVTAGGPGAVLAAVDANARAGQAAMVSLAFEESLDHYETAVDLLRRTVDTVAAGDAGDASPAGATTAADAGGGGGVDPDLVFRCWFGLGMSGGAMADRRRQRDGYLGAAQVAREQGWPQRLADAVIGFVAYVGTAGVGSNTPETSTFHEDERLAQELLRDALALAGEAPSATRCTLLAIATTQARMLDRSAEARALADEARAAAEALDEPTALPHARVTQLWSQLGEPFDPALREAPRELLAFDPGPELRVSLRVFVLPVLPIAALQLGDRAAYDDVRRWVTDDPNTWRSTHLRSYLRMWDTAMALAEGRFDEALRLAATPLPGAEGWGAWSVTCMVQRIVAAVEIGDPTARARLEMFVTMTPPPHPPVALAMAANVAAAAGDEAAARRHIAELRSQRPYDDLGWGAPLALRHLAEAAAHLGDTGLAAALLPVAERYEGQLLVSYTGTTIDGAGSRIAGQLLLTLGRLDEAVDRLRAGHDLERAFGADGLAARTGYWLARALLARRGLGDATAAERLVATTLRSADRLGMSLLGRALRLLPAPGEEAPTRHSPQTRQTRQPRQTRQSPQAPAEAARRPA